MRLLEAGVVPDGFTFSFILKACSRLSDLPTGRCVHGMVEKFGVFRSNSYLYNAVVNMYGRCGMMESARLVFEKMPERDVVTWNILITQFCKKGDMKSAEELFRCMPERNARTWTTVIDGYVKCGDPKEAVRVFEKMEDENVKLNEVTVVSILAACADLGLLDLGVRIHGDLTRLGYSENVRILNTLIDMYIKCGCLEVARTVFDAMEDCRTVVSWSAMIAGLAIHGHGEEALEVFSKMKTAGIRPNGVTFLGILHACSHMGLLEDGRRFFATMTKDYGVVPEIEHYGTMVDLLSRSGLVEEALEFIKKMPIPANSVVWGALLGGARVHKKIEIGEEATKHLRKLDPTNDGYYIVLSNIYAEAGRWEDAARVRRSMRDEGVRKTPGCSSITVDGVIHEFVAGDTNHPSAGKIYEKWEELLGEMKLRGYVPDTSVVLFDMEAADEAAKEGVVYRHSEKLAVCYGLLSTAEGTTIRIMKNLRVCSDCHNSLKLISTIVGRKIVVRDRNRFHCFEDGICSCRDYW